MKDDSFTPVDIPFVGNEGLRVRMGDDVSPIDFFELYVTADMIELFVRETNRYAGQYMAQHKDSMKEHSYAQQWKPTDANEMKTFLGLIFLMGVVYKPRLSMYWSTDELYSTPIFSQVMTRDRFLVLLKFWHFADNMDPSYDVRDPNRDKLHKVRPLIDMMRSRCKRVYAPGKYLSVDESLVLFKGRLGFKQYIRTKRARFGIKMYEICTSNGVTLDFLVYCGRGMFSDDDPNSELSTTERIAANLIEPYLGDGHCLFTDNFYTSPKLAEHLLVNNTYLCGTVKKGRKNFAKDLVKENLEKGDAAFYSNSKGVLGVKYRAVQNKSGNKPKVVHMLSTLHKANMVDTGKKDKDKNPILKPSCILDYNRQMGGVDLVDQQLHSFHTLRKTYKWYRKLALRLLMQCMLNAHKAYQFQTGSKQDLLSFSHDVINMLLVSSPKLNRELPMRDTVHRLTGRHFPAKKQPKEGAVDQRPKKKCRVCYARGIRTAKGAPVETVWICQSCPSQPGLHIEQGCFEAYHTQLNFS